MRLFFFCHVSDKPDFSVLHHKFERQSGVCSAVFYSESAERKKTFLEAGKHAVGECFRVSVVDVCIFRQQIYVFGAEKSLARHLSVFPVVASASLRGVAYFQSVEVQSVDVVFVFSVMVEKRRESSYRFQRADGDEPKCSVDEFSFRQFFFLGQFA